MDKDLDTVLGADLLDVPDDFTQRVMRGIEAVPQHRLNQLSLLEKLQEWVLQKLMSVFGGIHGLTRLSVFMFGILTVSAAA